MWVRSVLGSTGQRKQVKSAKAAMNQIFICSPPEIEEFARETYSGEARLHA